MEMEMGIVACIGADSVGVPGLEHHREKLVDALHPPAAPRPLPPCSSSPLPPPASVCCVPTFSPSLPALAPRNSCFARQGRRGRRGTWHAQGRGRDGMWIWGRGWNGGQGRGGERMESGHGKEVDVSGRKLCILTAIKPSNVEKEKIKFFKSDFTYNPQFEYANPALPNVLAKHSQASNKFLKQSVNIMERTLQKYGSYEKFEQATGGSLLPKSRIWNHVRKYMVKEGCLGEIVVHLTEDLLSRASMTVVNGRPTLTINVSTAREHWLEGMLRHEIGTHYFRGINNNSQPWCNWNGRKKLGLKPINPTEEGLASIHSVLFRKDPFLWRAALLYYTVYQASQMSFSQLFQDVGRFVKDPNTRWDYCVRAKRGWTDTSQPGCFSKDQVYLDGILQILRYRESIDFHLLMALGKVSYEEVDRLKEFAVIENMRVPHFLQDHVRYMEHLEKIMEVNELTDQELQDLIV
uniref:KIAA0895 n=1 Tax=Terrapene triunguis TaxID=2587831 RepID=A0A674KJ49_9SAUR